MPTHKHPLDVSCGNLSIAMASYRYTLKGLLSNLDTKILLLPWSWGSLFSVQFVQIVFSFYFFIFSVDY